MSHRSLLRARACAAFAAVLVAFPVSDCSDGDHTVQVQPPFSSSQLDDANYQDVVAQFQEAGFTNVTTEPIPDLIIGWLTADGEVEEISIAGDTEFESGEHFDPAVAVIVRYHTFPEDESPSPAPEQSATRAPSGETTTQAAATPSKAAETSPSTPTAPATLTVENNADLAALLTLKDPFDPSVAAFAATYQGQIIEFDGCVVGVAPHGSYKTRFDYLLSAGDYDPDSALGPAFQLSDINYHDFHFPPENAPSNVPVGTNLHIIAKVGEYDPVSGNFQLKPVATTVR